MKQCGTIGLLDTGDAKVNGYGFYFYLINGLKKASTILREYLAYVGGSLAS